MAFGKAVFLGVFVKFLLTGNNAIRIISGQILHDETFFMDDLNVQPTLGFEYSFEVEYPIENCCPIRDIYYTQKDYIDLKCFTNVAKHEQVWSKNDLHFLSPTDHVGTISDQLRCSTKHNNTKCFGTYTLQDFIPKRRWFLFGYLCDDLANNNKSLKGLSYKITVFNEYNETTCQKIKTSTDATLQCSEFLNYVTLPNVFGDTSQLQASSSFDALAGILGSMNEPCYQYLKEVACIGFFPPCINFTDNGGIIKTQTIQALCRETCQEFLYGCEKLLGNDMAKTINCDYFESKHNSSTCFYKEIKCIEPEQISHGGYHIIKGIKGNNNFPASTVIQYYCDNNYDLEGPGNSTCLYSGKWSAKSQCVFSAVKMALFIGIPLVFLAGIIVLCAIFLLKYKRQRALARKKLELCMHKRNGTHDAFISYNDSDSSRDKIFVKDTCYV